MKNDRIVVITYVFGGLGGRRNSDTIVASNQVQNEGIMKIFNTTLEFKLEDFWVGVFWRRDSGYGALDGYGSRIAYKQFDIWICLIPCFPLHLIRITRSSLSPRVGQRIKFDDKGVGVCKELTEKELTEEVEKTINNALADPVLPPPLTDNLKKEINALINSRLVAKSGEDKSDRDIVDRLRDSQPKGSTSGYLLNDAADEILQLRKLIKLHQCPQDVEKIQLFGRLFWETRG